MKNNIPSNNFATKFPWYMVKSFLFIAFIFELFFWFFFKNITFAQTTVIPSIVLLIMFFKIWKTCFFILTDNSLVVYKKFKVPFNRKFTYEFSDIYYVYVEYTMIGKFVHAYFKVYFLNQPKQVFTYDIDPDEMAIFAKKLKEKGVSVMLSSYFTYVPPKKVIYKKRKRLPR